MMYGSTVNELKSATQKEESTNPGGVLGYKRDGGVRRSLIFCTQKNTWTLCCAPKKIQDWKLFESCFRILRELWLGLRKNY